MVRFLNQYRESVQKGRKNTILNSTEYRQKNLSECKSFTFHLVEFADAKNQRILVEKTGSVSISLQLKLFSEGWSAQEQLRSTWPKVIFQIMDYALALNQSSMGGKFPRSSNLLLTQPCGEKKNVRSII